MHPRRWPLWAWALAAVAASFIRLDYAVGDYSFNTGVALLAGSWLGSRAGARSQALALAVLIPLSLLGFTGRVADWGYFGGRALAAAAAGRLAPGDGKLARGWQVRVPLILMAGTALVAAISWRQQLSALDLKTYYTSVIVLALFIAFWYAIRLVNQPLRVLNLTAALAIYYAAGLLWTAVLAGIAPSLLPAVLGAPSDLLFHGYATHLPGDVLTAVAVAFFTDPRRRATG